MTEHNHSPLPWTFTVAREERLGMGGRIEDAQGNVVVENVGPDDGAFICLAVSSARAGASESNGTKDVPNGELVPEQSELHLADIRIAELERQLQAAQKEIAALKETAASFR